MMVKIIELFYKYFFLYFSIQNNSMYIHTKVVYKIHEFSSYAHEK